LLIKAFPSNVEHLFEPDQEEGTEPAYARFSYFFKTGNYLQVIGRKK
jgi:hypothetical protein